MELLDKFASVQIEADRRITDEDRAYCLRHQEAFDKSGPALQRVADAMRDAAAEQEAIFAGMNECSDQYLSARNEFTTNVKSVYGTMRARNEQFVRSIISYFSKRYNVELNEDVVMLHLFPAKPVEPDCPYSIYQRYGDIPPEKIQSYRDAVDAYNEAYEKWEASLCTLPLRYEQIVDEIFVQLSGFSFEERAMNEFLERTWNASHYTVDYAWNGIKAGQEKFEIKKATITLTSGVYRSSYLDEFQLGDDFKVILDALVWYECGRMHEWASWIPAFSRSFCEVDLVETPNMSKLERIKLFKNGRVDIRFRSAAYAQKFAAQCLRRRPVRGKLEESA